MANSAYGDLQSMKRRGWAAVVGGAFMVALIGCIWVFLANAIAQHKITNYDAGSAQFFGQIFMGFALIILSGLFGVASGVVQIRSGRRSMVLTVGVLVAFLAGFVTMMIAVSGRHS